MFDVATLTRTRPRTNEEWLHDLRDTGPAGQAATQALWDHLERTVCFYLCRQRSDLAGLDPDELHQLAEDCTQEAMLIVRAKLDTFRGESKFTTCYRYRSDLRRAGVIALGGLFEGLVGFGIGVIGVSDLALRGVPVRVAIGTSHFVIMVTALAAVSPHVLEVLRGTAEIPWNIIAMTVPAVSVGGQLAAVVAGRVHPDKIRRFLAVLLVFLSLVITARGLWQLA